MTTAKSNNERDRQLGMTAGKARTRLVRELLFSYYTQLGKCDCKLCKKPTSLEDFEIFNHAKWMHMEREDALKAFQDLENWSVAHKECVLKLRNQPINKAVNKTKLLGHEPSKLRITIRNHLVYHLWLKLHPNECHQCSEPMDTIHNMSIEHKVPWLYSEDPVRLHFCQNNISMSHRKCNYGAARKSI